jgi:hypothetical protein
VNLYITGASPRVLSTYRKLRKYGFSRRDANLIIVGVVLASGRGVVDVKRRASRDLYGGVPIEGNAPVIKEVDAALDWAAPEEARKVTLEEVLKERIAIMHEFDAARSTIAKARQLAWDLYANRAGLEVDGKRLAVLHNLLSGETAS